MHTKSPFYRSRVGHWRDKQITQPQEEGSPLGLGWGLMEDREAEEERRENTQARPPAFQLQRHQGGQVESLAGLITSVGTTTRVAHAPCFQDGNLTLLWDQRPAQEADNLQGCPSLLSTGEPQRLRNKGVRPGPKKTPTRATHYRLLQTRRSIPYSLRAFAQAVPSAWVTFPRDLYPSSKDCRSSNATSQGRPL